MKRLWMCLPCVAVLAAIEPVGQVISSAATPPATVPSAVATQPIEDGSPLARRLESVDAAMGKVLDLKAAFEQKRHTPLLKKPLVSKGVVWTKGDLVRWDTTTPRASSLIIGHGSIRMYYPADKLVEIYPVGEGFKDLAGAPLPRLSVLKARFDIVAIAPDVLGVGDAGERFLALQLTPKSEELRKHVALVRVLIDESQPAASKVVMIDPDGETTEITFRDIRINPGVTNEQIDPVLPEGVRVSRPLGESKAEPGKPADSGAKPQDRTPATKDKP